MELSAFGWNIRLRLLRARENYRIHASLNRKITPQLKQLGSDDILIDKKYLRINVGGGKNHPKVDGWSIVDLRSTADYNVNLEKDQLPFDDNSIGVIFCSHTLEHINPHRLAHVLREFNRVLIPGGVLRVAVPDIELAIKHYVNKDRDFFENADVSPLSRELPIGGLLASWFYSSRLEEATVVGKGEGHVHCFDYDYMKYWLEKFNFTNVERSSYRNSKVPELRGIEFDRYEDESLFAEAIKPTRH